MFLPEIPAGCLRCEWADLPEAGSVGTCAEAGVFGAVPGVLGALEAAEAIKYLLGMQSAAAKFTALINLHTLEFHRVERVQNNDCPLCGALPKIRRIDPMDYQSRSEVWEISGSANIADLYSFEWVDIRSLSERNERDDLESKMIHRPLENQKDIEALNGNKKYLLICERGLRSKQLTRRLRELGRHDFFSFDGGLKALRRSVSS